LQKKHDIHPALYNIYFVYQNVEFRNEIQDLCIRENPLVEYKTWFKEEKEKRIQDYKSNKSKNKKK